MAVRVSLTAITIYMSIMKDYMSGKQYRRFLSIATREDKEFVYKYFDRKFIEYFEDKYNRNIAYYEDMLEELQEIRSKDGIIAFFQRILVNIGQEGMTGYMNMVYSDIVKMGYFNRNSNGKKVLPKDGR